MSFLFFGDSLTEGDNCDTRFTEFLPDEWDIWNFGVSGTTIGEYSIYPVDGNSLLSQIGKNQDMIRYASHIFIEYGSNDISAIMCGFTTIQTVIVSFVKAIDWIKQLNPYVKIYFLTFGEKDVVCDRADRMCNYLKNDYFKSFNFDFPSSIYVKLYNELVDNISKLCGTISIFDSSMIGKYISDDNIHPDALGHKRIAQHIVEGIYRA